LTIIKTRDSKLIK